MPLTETGQVCWAAILNLFYSPGITLLSSGKGYYTIAFSLKIHYKGKKLGQNRGRVIGSPPNLITWSHNHAPPLQKIWTKFLHNFGDILFTRKDYTQKDTRTHTHTHTHAITHQQYRINCAPAGNTADNNNSNQRALDTAHYLRRRH